MGIFYRKKDKILTGAILVVSLAGILYFGYLAIRDNARNNQENPFAYNIESFEDSDAELVHYSEAGRIKTGLPEVSGIAVGPDDAIYVIGGNSVLIYNREGINQSTIKTDGPGRCLAVDKYHDLYIGMGDHVEIYDSKGEKKAGWKTFGEEAIITSIALSKDAVFVADAGNQIVWKCDKSGTKRERIGDKNEAKDIPGFIIPSPYFDVAVDADGFLWAANTGRHSLENYTAEGDFRTSWGEFGMEIQGFSGCCNPSHFALLEDGSFVTSEKGLVRVKVYNRIGRLVSVVAPTEQFIEGTVGLDLAVDSSQKIYVLDPPQKLVRIFEKKNL